MTNQNERLSSVAIIAMEGRFPGANDLGAFWQNLALGKCSIRQFGEDELKSAGIRESALRDPDYVKVGAVLEGIDLFDADFFGFTARQAETLDPQHRLFLQCAWHALESAGYAAADAGGRIGVFAGSAPSTYSRNHRPEASPLMNALGWPEMGESCGGECLASTVSSLLGLTGPSISVQTFCSTSLVAVHLSCQSLLAGDCDLALAGGVAVAVPQIRGYFYQEGGLLSPDGSCRAFDAGANGCVMGSGVGILALKRLEDALRDGDQVLALIRGSAVNHDGASGATRRTPTPEGQSEVVREAMERAGVDPQTIQYVEGNGTAVPPWDAAELAAMNEAFQHVPAGYRCPIGSLKPNVGHLDRASGIAGVIKTILAIRHGQVPPTLQHQRPNPEWESDNSRFYVPTALASWPATAGPKRAGVSSFGLGGANAHLILEESPPRDASGPSRKFHLLVLSAKNLPALEQATADLARHVEATPDVNPADVAFTLQAGRRALAHRRFAVCEEASAATELLKAKKPGQVWTAETSHPHRPVAFLFPGVGGQYTGMGQGLYDSEPTYRDFVDQCADLLKASLGEDIREVMYSPSQDRSQPRQQNQGLDLRAMLSRRGGAEEVPEPLRGTSLAHSCLFTVEYALTRLLETWGIEPQALIGHSLGEYTAACVAGVFSLEDGLRLLVERARRIESLPQGAMWGVGLSEEEVRPFLDDELELAAINSPQAVVISGSLSAVPRFEEQLTSQHVAFRRLPATHAFHSSMIAPASDDLIDLFGAIDLNAPSIPLVSCERGRWITAEEVTDPQYWASQMCHKVRFEQGLGCLLDSGNHFLLEVGPGESLASLAKQHPACGRDRIGLVQGTMRSVHERCDDVAFLLGAMGHLWLAGIDPDWRGFHSGQRRQRLSLPTYPFQQKRYWIDPVGEGEGKREEPARAGSPHQPQAIQSANAGEPSAKTRDLADWFYVRCWKETPPTLQDRPVASGQSTECRLLLLDESGFGRKLGLALQDSGHNAVFVSRGECFERHDANSFTVCPHRRSDYAQLFRAVQEDGQSVRGVIHLWSLDGRGPSAGDPLDTLDEHMEQRFTSVLTLVQSLGDANLDGREIIAVSNELHDITGTERALPIDATILGPCRAVRYEYKTIGCRNVDMDLAQSSESEAVQALLGEILFGSRDPVVALRGHHRWVEAFEPIRLPKTHTEESPYRKGGVYLITGGYGGIGLALGQHLARVASAKVILLGRTGLPQSDGPMSASARENLERVQAINDAGGEVLALTADVGDAEEMQGALRQALEHFGTIHGVFHLAGVAPYGLIPLKTVEAASEVMHPKVTGTVVLHSELRDIPLDFLVAFSSISSVTGGGPGQVDYCAANAFLDAFACAHPVRDGRSVAIAWGQWERDAWQDGLWGFPEEVRVSAMERRRQYGISLEEGFEALDRVLSRRLTHVIVTPRSLRAVVDESRDFSVSNILDRVTSNRQSQPRAPRPDLGSMYVAPTTASQRRIASLWEELLNIEQVGMDDDFFELGGNSLIGVHLIARLQEAFPASAIPTGSFFEAPTVRTMARYLEDA